MVFCFELARHQQVVMCGVDELVDAGKAFHHVGSCDSLRADKRKQQPFPPLAMNCRECQLNVQSAGS